MSLRWGWTADGWQYSIYWDETAGFTVVFTNEFKEIWALDDIKVRKVDEWRFGAFVEGKLYAGVSLRDVVYSIAERISYRLEHDGSWVIRGEAALKEMERLRELGLRPEMPPVPAVLPFGRTRLIWEKATPVKPMIVARVERERFRRRSPTPPRKVTIGLSDKERRDLRTIFSYLMRQLGMSEKAYQVELEGRIALWDIRYKNEPDAFKYAREDLIDWVEKLYRAELGL